MVKPQQPELRRSDRGATSDDATKERLSAPGLPGVDEAGGPIPVDNLPGHHPPQEQDKPSGEAFVAKMHALAVAEAEAAEATAEEPDGDRPTEAPMPRAEREAEVVDLAELERRLDEGASPVADRVASLAGKPFAIMGSVLGAVRDRLPGS